LALTHMSDAFYWPLVVIEFVLLLFLHMAMCLSAFKS